MHSVSVWNINDCFTHSGALRSVEYVYRKHLNEYHTETSCYSALYGRKTQWLCKALCDQDQTCSVIRMPGLDGKYLESLSYKKECKCCCSSSFVFWFVDVTERLVFGCSVRVSVGRWGADAIEDLAYQFWHRSLKTQFLVETKKQA